MTFEALKSESDKRKMSLKDANVSTMNGNVEVKAESMNVRKERCVSNMPVFY